MTADAEPLWRFDHWEEGEGNAPCVPLGGNFRLPRIEVRLPVGSKVACRAVFVVDEVEVEALIQSVTPDHGAPGQMVVISGQNLDPNSLVTFNGVDAEVMSSSRSQLVTRVPEGATSGPIGVAGDTGYLEYPAFAIPGATDPQPEDMGTAVLDMMAPPPDLMRMGDLAGAVTIDSFTLMSSTAHGAGAEQQARSITVAWSSTNATDCSIDPGNGVTSGVATSGTRVMSIISEQTLTLSCNGPAGPAIRTLKVPGYATFRIGWTRVEPAIPSINQSYRVVFAAPPGATCTFDGAAQTESTPGLYSVYRTAPATGQTLTHAIACSSAAGNEMLSVSVPVVSASRVELTRWGQRTRLTANESIALSFVASYATDCSLDGVSVGNGSSLTTRTFTPPSGTTTYTLICTTTGTGTQYSFPWVVEKE